MSFIASWESAQVILVNRAVTLLAKDIDDVYDSDTLERILPTFKDMETPFYVEQEVSRQIDFDPDFSIHTITQAQISDIIAHTSYSMVF